MALLDLKTRLTKKIDAETTMTISENLTGERIFIEFATNDGRLRLEKSFTTSGLGSRDSEIFIQSIKCTNDLFTYFGLPKEN